MLLDILSFFSQNVNNHLSLVITLHPLNSNSITNNKTVRCPYTETISRITYYLNNSYLSLYINMCWRQTYLIAGYAVCTLANVLIYADDAAHTLPEHPLIEITKYRKQRTYSKVFWYFQKLI